MTTVPPFSANSVIRRTPSSPIRYAFGTTSTLYPSSDDDADTTSTGWLFDHSGV